MQDTNHTSNTAFDADNYNHDATHPEWAPKGWTHIIEGHPCYDPAKVCHYAHVCSFAGGVACWLSCPSKGPMAALL